MRSFAFGCEALGRPVPERAAILGLVGRPLGEMYARLLDADDAETDRFVAAYRARAAKHMTDETVLFPHTRAVIERLTDSGTRLGIVTTKIRVRVEEVLERHDLCGCFEVVVGGDDVAAHKPNPAGIHRALAVLGGRGRFAGARDVYVGDSVTDAEAASAAGIDFVAVTAGETPAAAFTRFEPLAILPGLEGLPSALGL